MMTTVHEYNNLFGVCFQMKKLRIHFCLSFFFRMKPWSTFLCYTIILFNIFYLISIPCRPPLFFWKQRDCGEGEVSLCSDFPWIFLITWSPIHVWTDGHVCCCVFFFFFHKTCNYHNSIPSRWYTPSSRWYTWAQ